MATAKRASLSQACKDVEDIYRAASEEEQAEILDRLRYIRDEEGIGRPSKYKPEYAHTAQQLVTLGATDEEIADFFGINARTLYRWKNTHQDFCQSLKLGKAACDERVERSLYENALAGNTAAQVFYLKNRRAQEWRDKREYTVQDHRSEDDIAKALMARVNQADKGKRPN